MTANCCIINAARSQAMNSAAVKQFKPVYQVGCCGNFVDFDPPRQLGAVVDRETIEILAKQIRELKEEKQTLIAKLCLYTNPIEDYDFDN